MFSGPELEATFSNYAKEAKMTREEFALKIRWAIFFKVIGCINTFLMAPQLFTLLSTMKTAGVSLVSIALIVLVQGTFGLHGFFIRDETLMKSNGAACCLSIVTFISAVYLRRTGH